MSILKKHFTVLVADDDESERLKFIQLLQLSSYKLKIESVLNGVELVNHLLRPESDKRFPDLILTDLYMPFAGGIQVLKQINEHSDLKKIPIYVFSKNFDSTIRTKVLEYGATDFYPKPENIAELKKIINDILEINSPKFHDIK
jgi:CheY-like chemotaxis protein